MTKPINIDSIRQRFSHAYMHVILALCLLLMQQFALAHSIEHSLELEPESHAEVCQICHSVTSHAALAPDCRFVFKQNPHAVYSFTDQSVSVAQRQHFAIRAPPVFK